MIFYVSSKNLIEYFAVVTKGDKPTLKSEDALKDIEEFVNIFTVLYPSKASFELLSKLIIKSKPKGLRVHDIEIAAIALVNEVNSLATANVSDFKMIKDLKLIHP